MSHWQKSVEARVFFACLMSCGLTGILGCGGAATEGPATPTPAAEAKTADTPGATPAAAPVVSSLNLAWLPESTEIVVQLQVGQLVKAESLAMLFAGPIAESLTPGFGITLDQIERVTLGMGGLQGLDNEQLVMGPQGLAPLQQSTVLVVHANRDLSLETLQAGNETRQHGQRDYVVGNAGVPVCAALLDARTAVLASEEFLKEILDGKSAVDVSRFQFVNGAADVTIAFAPKDRSVFQGDGSGAPSPRAQQVVESIKQHATAAGLEITFGTETNFGVQVACDTSKAATTLSTQLRELLIEQQAAADPDQPPFAKELLEYAQTLARGNVATLGSKLTAPTTQQIVGYGQMFAALALASSSNDMLPGAPPSPSLEELLARATPAAESENLPTGSEAAAAILWTHLDDFYSSDDLIPPDQLEARIFLHAGDAAKIAAAGNMRVTQARSGERDLRQNFDQVAGDQRTGSLTSIDRSNGFDPQPANGIMFPIVFQHPEPMIEQISILSGQIDLLVASALEPTRTVTIKELIEQAGTDPLYTSIGMTIERLRDEFSGNESIRIRTNASGLLGDLMVLDKNGDRSFEIWSSGSLEPNGASQYRLDASEGNIADDTQVRFQVLSGLKSVTVAFTFKDLPVPTPERLPSADQLKLAHWTPTELPEALPEGLNMDARCHWSQFQFLDADGNPQPRPLDVDVDLTGPLAWQIIAIGKYEFQSVATAAGPLARNGQLYDVEPYERLVSLEEVQVAPGTTPRARFSFARPEGTPDQLTELLGQLSIVTAEKVDFVELPHVFADGASELTHPLLTERGIELKLEKIDNSYTITAVTTSPESLGAMEVLSVDRGPLDDLYGGRSGLDGAVQYMFSAEEGIPTNAVVRLQLYSGIQRHDIPFKFTNLPIPAEPKNE